MQALEFGAQFFCSGPDLLPGKLLCPARGPGTEVSEADPEVEQLCVLLGSVQPVRDADGEEDTPEAIARVSVVVAAAPRRERRVVPAEDEIEVRLQEVRGQGLLVYPRAGPGVEPTPLRDARCAGSSHRLRRAGASPTRPRVRVPRSRPPGAACPRRGPPRREPARSRSRCASGCAGSPRSSRALRRRL